VLRPSILSASPSAFHLALLALAAGAACIALSPILVRLSEVGPTVTAFWRAALAVPFLAALVALPGRAPRAIRPGDRWRLAAAGLFFAGDLAFWHWSIRFTSVANATLFANFAPVFVAAGAWLLFAERPGGRFLAGLVLAFAGAFCLLGESLRVGGDHALGDGLGVATAVCLSAYLLAVRSLRARLGAAGIMLWTSLATATLLLPVAWLSGEGFWPATLAGWAVLVGLGRRRPGAPSAAAPAAAAAGAHPGGRRRQGGRRDGAGGRGALAGRTLGSGGDALRPRPALPPHRGGRGGAPGARRRRPRSRLAHPRRAARTDFRRPRLCWSPAAARPCWRCPSRASRWPTSSRSTAHC
jgi:drug/metabolite transporter (DMT)-like permease